MSQRIDDLKCLILDMKPDETETFAYDKDIDIIIQSFHDGWFSVGIIKSRQSSFHSIHISNLDHLSGVLSDLSEQ